MIALLATVAIGATFGLVFALTRRIWVWLASRLE